MHVADDERGFAMVIAVFVLAMLISVTAAALRMSQSDIVTSRNYRSASQALFAAEAGVNHAIMVINQGGAGGVVNLQNDAIAGWVALSRNLPQLASFSYSVGLTSDPMYPGDPNRGVLTSTATGSDNSTRTVVAGIKTGNVPAAPPGAIYLATNNPTNSTFNGNNFQIDGNDQNCCAPNAVGSAGPQPAVPGLTARTDTNAQEARDSLNNGQDNNVTGLGFVPGNPATPSVSSAQGMSTSQIDQMINDLLNLPHCTLASSTFNNSTAKCPPNNDFGSVASPQIVYLPGNGSGVTMGNGNPTGYGILIVENALTINGNLDWNGLIIVRGTTQLTDVSGSATIFGSLWTTDFNVTVAGHADIQYSSQALALASQAGCVTPPCGPRLPAPVAMTSWHDVY